MLQLYFKSHLCPLKLYACIYFQVTVGYSKPVQYNLTPSRCALGKTLGRGRRQAFAKHAYRDRAVKRHIIRLVSQECKLEIKKLCKKDSPNSEKQERRPDDFYMEVLFRSSPGERSSTVSTASVMHPHCYFSESQSYHWNVCSHPNKGPLFFSLSCAKNCVFGAVCRPLQQTGRCDLHLYC